jgi:hypothetical protein
MPREQQPLARSHLWSSGWQFAYVFEELFTNALLQGLTNNRT